MSHLPLQTIADLLSARGVTVQIWPGAQGRSARMWGAAGYPKGCQAICEHHTGSTGNNPANDINYIISGKGEGYVIANQYTGIDGTVHLLASGPTYTEGAGGPLGIIPVNGGNSVCWSNEIAGYDGRTYTSAQQAAVVESAVVVGMIAAEQYKWPDDLYGRNRLFSHFEWAPGRKVDPGGISQWSPNGGMWDMDAFRSTVRAAANSTPTTWKDGGTMLHTNEPHARLIDTRSDPKWKRKLRADEVLQVTIPAPAGVTPKTAIVNVTVVDPDQPGFVQVTGKTFGPASTGNFQPGESPRASPCIAAVVGGKISIKLARATAHVVVDLQGVVD